MFILSTPNIYLPISQEDAHIALLDLNEDKMALFSIFDGHGGKAVAKFAAKYMVCKQPTLI